MYARSENVENLRICTSSLEPVLLFSVMYNKFSCAGSNEHDSVNINKLKNAQTQLVPISVARDRDIAYHVVIQWPNSHLILVVVCQNVYYLGCGLCEICVL